MTKIMKPSNLTMDYLQKELIEANKRITELEGKYGEIPKTYTVEHLMSRIKFFETRLEHFTELRDNEKMLYKHLRDPVYELMDMVKQIKIFLRRTTEFKYDTD